MTVLWWCQLCDHQAKVTIRPAADTDAVEHLAARHRAVFAPHHLVATTKAVKP